MKMRHFSFFSLATACAFLTGGAALLGGSGCGGSSSSGGSGGSTGGGGTSGGPTVAPGDEISNFEDLAAATVLMQSGRNGYWYTYNDWAAGGADAATCMQTPKSGPQSAPDPAPVYIGSAPPTSAPGTTGSLALHAQWSGCSVWGAGIGADLGQPPQDGGTYTGPKVPYDVGSFAGVTFWAMATAGSDTALRIKFPMTDETKVEDGGTCVESSTNKCSDDWGYKFSLPANGNWKQITVRWADTNNFAVEGWGAKFDWNPAHVTSIQIQSQDKNETYDFWIDDMGFIK